MLLILYLLTVPAANLLITKFGVIPIGFGLMAPAGVFTIGLAMVLRDAVQARYGLRTSMATIVAGTALSAFLAPPALVLASAAAFLLSETADTLVYTPLRKRGLMVAVLASGIVGAVIDSALFLYLAFGDLTFLLGQVVGKLEMTFIAMVVLYAHLRVKSDGALSR